MIAFNCLVSAFNFNLIAISKSIFSSNNTNKLSPQELVDAADCVFSVQIIQINLVLKNT